MDKHQIIISSISIDSDPELSFEELCTACRVSPEYIEQLIEYGVIDLQGINLEEYRFNLTHLQRIRTMVHLQQDLDVNLPGAALVVDLLEEMEQMRSKIEMLEKHFFIK